jgi:hypothetical protein
LKPNKLSYVICRKKTIQPSTKELSISIEIKLSKSLRMQTRKKTHVLRRRTGEMVVGVTVGLPRGCPPLGDPWLEREEDLERRALQQTKGGLTTEKYKTSWDLAIIDTMEI